MNFVYLVFQWFVSTIRPVCKTVLSEVEFINRCLFIYTGWLWVWFAHFTIICKILPRGYKVVLAGGFWYGCCYIHQGEWSILKQ